MDRAEAEQRILRAVDRLLREDTYLLVHDVNERSITHRLAAHLGPEFEGWHVDCEYNRDSHEPKRLSLPRRTDIAGDDEHATTVFPDIIVHRRGTNANLVVIEAKKTTNQDNHEWDKKKLHAFRNSDQLCYKIGVFLLLETRPGRETAVVVDFVDGRRERLTLPIHG